MTDSISVNFTAEELSVVKHALAQFIRVTAMISPTHPLFSAYGRLMGGDHMTPEEAREAFGDAWYVSATGRKFLHRPDCETPVTPKQYQKATEAALLARGRKALGK